MKSSLASVPRLAPALSVSVVLGGLLVANPAKTDDRFPALQLKDMSVPQRQVANETLPGPRKSLRGRFNAWLRSPELANRLQKVGEYLRLRTSVPARLNEFAILISAIAWNAPYERCAHYLLAMKAGVKPSVAADLAKAYVPLECPPTRRSSLIS